MNFENTISADAIALGNALLTGIAMGVYYDLFRILRRVFHFSYGTIVAQDVFFWLSGAVGVFFICIWSSGGVVRIFFVFAVLLSWLVYAMTIGSLLMFVADKVIAVIRLINRIILNKALLPAFDLTKRAANKSITAIKRSKLRKKLVNRWHKM